VRIAAVAKGGQHHRAGRRAFRLHLVEGEATGGQPAEAQPGIAPPRAVIDPLRHRLAELAVAGDVDAGLLLAAHDIADSGAEGRRECRLVDRLVLVKGAVGFDQLVGTRQAAGMAGEDVIAAHSAAASLFR
jgi:hypothetical protein